MALFEIRDFANYGWTAAGKSCSGCGAGYECGRGFKVVKFHEYTASYCSTDLEMSRLASNTEISPVTVSRQRCARPAFLHLQVMAAFTLPPKAINNSQRSRRLTILRILAQAQILVEGFRIRLAA
jgi:hypothetical protein